MLACAGIVASACIGNSQARARNAVAAGDQYLEQGKYQEAIIEYRNALQHDARMGDVRLKLGQAYLGVRDASNAYREILRAADLLPADPAAQLKAGEMLLLAGDFDGARQRARRVLEHEASNVNAHILLGNALAGLKDLSGAIVETEQAIDNDPHRTLSYTNLGALQYAKGDRNAAEAAFVRAVAINERSIVAHLALANFYWAVGRLPEAEQELKNSVTLEPNSSIANQSLAAFYLASKRPQDAERYLKAYADRSGEGGAQLTLADFYLTAGKQREARSVLTTLSRQEQWFVPATLRLAALDFADGHRDKAYDGLSAALQRDPKNTGALLLRARFLLIEKKNPEALTVAQKVVESDRRSAAGHFLLGAALEANGKPDEAARAFQEVVKLQPDALPAHLELAQLSLRKGDAAAAVQHSEDAVHVRPQSGNAHLALARSLASQGNLPAAETELNTLVREAPDSPEVQILLGQIYSAKRDLPQARKAFSHALEVDKQSTDALAGILTLDLAEKRNDDATARMEARLKAAPGSTADWVLAGHTFMALGNMPRAEDSFRKALDIDSANMGAYEGLASVYLVERHLDAAEKEFAEIARREPQSVMAITMVGMILERQNKRSEARQRYEQALVIDPRAPVASNNLAWSYVEDGGNLDVALQLAQTAKSQLPSRHEVDDTLGWIYSKKGLATLAIPSLRASVAADPNNPAYLYHLGIAYDQSGDKLHAKEALARALSLRDDFPGADQARKVLNGIK
jgi:tetratricopeptide (TPR) repeat protein